MLKSNCDFSYFFTYDRPKILYFGMSQYAYKLYAYTKKNMYFELITQQEINQTRLYQNCNNISWKILESISSTLPAQPWCLGDNKLDEIRSRFYIKHDENPKITKDYYMRIYKNCKHNCAKLTSKNRDYGSYWQIEVRDMNGFAW